MSICRVRHAFLPIAGADRSACGRVLFSVRRTGGIAIEQRCVHRLHASSDICCLVGLGIGVASAASAMAYSRFLRGPVWKPHVKARSQENPAYPCRSPVPNDKVAWSTSWPEYQPTIWTHPKLLTASYADPEVVPKAELLARLSHEGPIALTVEQVPRNPRGRTGMRGRGLLGKWGPNYCADPIVTRHDPITGKLQMVAIQRKDIGVWACPGGMVDPGESVSVTVKREFTEEAGNITDANQKQLFNKMVEELFSSGDVVYRGYVDDPRNTDNAWMETVAFHFHCSPELGAMLPLEAGDDAGQVTWLDIDMNDPRYRNLYASQREWTDAVAQKFK